MEQADMLAPRRVRLVYQDTPLAEAVADFKAKSGYDLSVLDPGGKLTDRTVTLDTGDVTFWQALGQFCRQARLVEATAPTAGLRGRPGGKIGGAAGVFVGGGGVVAPAGVGVPMAAAPPLASGRIVLIDGQLLPLPTDDGTAVRVRARPGAGAPGAAAKGTAQLVLDVAPEPKLRLQRVVSVAVGKAVDDQGQTREPYEPLGSVADGIGPFSWTGDATVTFTKAPKAAAALREVSGTVTAQVLKAPQPYLVVIDLVGSAGKSVRAADGGALRILAVTQAPTGDVKVRFTIDPPARLVPAGGLSRVALRAGRMVVSGNNGDGSEHAFAVLDAKGAVLTPDSVMVLGNAGAVEYVVTCPPREGQGGPA
jgi:hypothetical protein